jgi:hypothetical protein
MLRVSLWLVFLAALATASCGPKVDLTKGLQVVDVSTGWWDAGVVDGQNKLVPSVTFKFKNVSDQTLDILQANVVFRRVTEDKEWGSSFERITGSEGLAPGATSASHTVKSSLGYTASPPQSRQDMFANSQFVDAKVQLFAKYSNTQWQKVGEYAVPRTLITK